MTKTREAGLVVVTRPEAQAGPIAAALGAGGHHVLIEPMLTIVPFNGPSDAPLPALDRFGALAFSSANAAQIFATMSGERSLPAYAVGDSTAAALRVAGFEDVRIASGDAEALAGLIATDHIDPIAVLHLSGRDVARNLSQLLAGTGVTVERHVLYDAVAATALTPRLTEALYACAVESVLFFSTRTARTFGTLIMQSGLENLVGSVAALCFSESIAREARRLAWGRVAVADHPTVQSILALATTSGGVLDG